MFVSWMKRWMVVGAVVVSGTAACSGDHATAPATPRLTVVGRLERGVTARVVVRVGGDSLVGSQLVIQATPANQVTVGNDGTVTFLQAGSVTLQARLPNDSVISGTFTVAVPPLIVFDLSQNGNRDIYEAALDGADVTRLTTADGDDVHPTVAGGVIVFTSYRNSEADLYSLTLSTMIERRLTSTAQNETDPAFSLDGTRLAFVQGTNGVDRVWVSASDGRGAVRLTTETSPSPEESPAWSPTGTVLFTSTVSGSADLSTVVAANAPAAALPLTAANTSSAEVEGAWSADGKQIAFVSTRSGGSELYVLDVASGHVMAIPSAGNNVGQPMWLLDGRIVYAVLTGETSQLAWFDPADPASAHPITLPAGNPQNPAAVR